MFFNPCFNYLRRKSPYDGKTCPASKSKQALFTFCVGGKFKFQIDDENFYLILPFSLLSRLALGLNSIWFILLCINETRKQSFERFYAKTKIMMLFLHSRQTQIALQFVQCITSMNFHQSQWGSECDWWHHNFEFCDTVLFYTKLALSYQRPFRIHVFNFALLFLTLV